MKGKLITAVPLADYTTWRVGGPAKQLYKPSDIIDLSYFLAQLPVDENILWIGLGSNLLVRDGGFNGTVIVTQGALMTMELVDNLTVKIAAGVACGTAARFCARLGLTGLEFLAGIPGTIGGALKMNAGAHGYETWQFVTACDTIDRQGKSRYRLAKDYRYDYRQVHLPAEEWFTAGYFQLLSGDKAESLQRIKTLLNHRAATQPIHYPNCGSVFRNPPSHFAARLIENCGLKGHRIGGASVAIKHANFIINDQKACARDIEQLILKVSSQVQQQQKIKLIREVHIAGDELID